MKRIKYLYTGAIAATLLVSSCKKDFLETKPSENISPGQIADASTQDPTLLKGAVSGLYSTMYNTGTGGTTNHDDFGQKGYDIYGDMLASDMVLGAVTYGWYSGVVRYQSTKDYTSNPAYQPWRYYYRIIFAANNLIETLGGNDAVPANATLKSYMGQAKGMRAYAYFYLAQFYADKGFGTGSEKILPLYTDTKGQSVPLSTSAQVYDQIIKDLTAAIDLLNGYTRQNKSEVDVNVAKGLLAYAYAARGTNEDLAKVVTLTDDVLAVYPLTTKNAVAAQFDASGALTNPESGFNTVSTPSWIWGVDLTLAAELDLISWWGQIDIYTYSYAWAGDPKYIDAGLYDSIHSDDIRKTQFFNNKPPYTDEHGDYGGLVPQGKFFNSARVEGGQRNVTDDYIYMRADEMQLLNAEAKARLGQDADAKTSLKKLLALRQTNSSYVDALTGNALKEEIYLQTRIELWGEGKVYLAMKRNKHSVTRGANHLFNAGETFSYDADELTFPIPQAEVINNANLYK